MPATITTDIRGTEVPVSIDDYGTFQATLAGDTYSDATLSGLRTQLMAAHKAAAAGVEIPFTLLRRNQETDRLEPVTVTATGLHQARVGVVLIRWPGGERDTFAARRSTYVLRQLDDGETEQLRFLLERVEVAKADLAEYTEARTVDLISAVQAATDAKVGSDA